MNTRCPVCYRPVAAIDTTRRVLRHNDKAGGMCPMTGRHLPLEQTERRSAQQ
jgi:hypothetical protein